MAFLAGSVGVSARQDIWSELRRSDESGSAALPSSVLNKASHRDDDVMQAI